MESVQRALFTVEGEESLVQIANILNENVYVLLALNIENQTLYRELGRALPGLEYKAGDKIPLTVIDKMKDGQDIIVPCSSEEESGSEERRRNHSERDQNGRFQRGDETSDPSQQSQRNRPDQSSGRRPKRKRPAEQFLGSVDKDYLAPESDSPGVKKWFPDFLSAVCYYIHEARKARAKRGDICSIEDAWQWRYVKPNLWD